MGFLKELYTLTRFEHALMLAIAVLIAIVIVQGGLPSCPCILLVLLVPIFSEMGSFALNDYLDIEADKANRMGGRPLVKGTLSPRFALQFSIVCLLGSTIIALFINPYAFVIALAFNVLAVLYNWKLKDLPLLGNIYIGTTMAIPFIFGNYVVSPQLSVMAVILALLGFVAGLAREIVKSVEDMEGDIKARASRTLPVIIGERPALIIAALLYLIFIALTAAPIAFGMKIAIIPAIIILAADAGILIVAFRLLTMNKRNRGKALKDARKQSLAFLFLGLIGLLLASLL
ncbi:MAG: UbiA family prenyltransferase [Candidatus Micrarchaeota archaeon]